MDRLLGSVRALRLYRDLLVSAQAARSTRRYDLFLSMVYVLPAFTRARSSRRTGTSHANPSGAT